MRDSDPEPNLRRTLSAWQATGAQYEYKVITVDPRADRASVHRSLTDEAEYGRWELARTVHYAGGSRKVWLRRKIIRVVRTA